MKETFSGHEANAYAAPFSKPKTDKVEGAVGAPNAAKLPARELKNYPTCLSRVGYSKQVPEL